MNSLTAKSYLYRSPRTFVPFFVLAAGLLFTIVVSYRLASVGEAEDQARFRALVQEVHASIASRVETYTALLRAGTGLFAANDTLDANQFRSFVERLDLHNRYPGVQGIGFLLQISPQEKTALIESQKRAGFVNFRVWPESQGSEYYPIIYIEPLDQRNQAAIGYDMFTEPVRRAAMERARDSGAPAASALVTLVQEIHPQTKQAGFLIYAPVYRKTQSTSTESERRRALRGFVYSPFRADDFLRGIVSHNTYDNIEFRVYDGREIKPEDLLHESSKPNELARPNHDSLFIATTNLDVAGRSWTITYASTPGFYLSYGKSWVPYTLMTGALLSFLFFAVTRSQIRARSASEQAASELRQVETNLRQTLTERERAEDALRESEERYRELVENANDIVFTLDLGGTITSVNKAVESTTGYSREELIGMNMSDFLTPESADAARQMMARKLAGEERTNYEVDVRTKNGSVLTLEVSSRLLVTGAQPVGVQGVARDITNRRRAEETLREADQRALSEYERLLERISSLAQALGMGRDLLTIFRALREFSVVSVPCDGLFVSLYDAERDVRTACYAWGDGNEFDTSALPPMPVNTSGPNSRAVRTGQVIITDDYMSTPRSHPVVILGPDNGLRPQSSLAIPMAVMGRIVGTIEVQSYNRSAFREEHATAMRMAANLTAVAIQNAQLLGRESSARSAAEESNRLKDEFLATVSHELRTPLTAILGWSRMLESGSINDPMAARALETIRRNAQAQSQIIDDILDVSRIITGKLYFDLHPIDLTPVIEAAVNVVRPTAEAKGVTIETEFDSLPAVVTGDSNRLQQVVWNLLSNAVKFTSSGGKVHLGLHHVGSQVEIRVRDTGQGISREFLPFVFDRFRQADSTSTRRHGGLGLGLAIARHLVEIHGGTIKAESLGEGKGATLSVRLPSVGSIAILNKQLARESEEAGKVFVADPRLDGIHVLLVDDDLDTLDLLSAVLKQHNAIVTPVSSAADAIKAINISKPDIVISDIAMPGENGYQLLERIRAMNFDDSRPIPALAITAYAKQEDRELALASGYQAYLAKPIELSDLVTAVAQAVRRD